MTALAVLGGDEVVSIEPPGIRLEAQLDTGTVISLLDARNTREFERDGKLWVKFNIVDRKTGISVEVSRAVVRTLVNKSSSAPRRYVVNLKAVVGSIDQFTDFVLADRSNSHHPVLLGRSFLRDQAVVDVSKHFTADKLPK